MPPPASTCCRPPSGVTTEPSARPAFYAARGGPLRDWWTLLHPPYTAWHLAYVAIGAALAPRLHTGRLLLTLAAFLLALGVAAHALDELRGRPLGTGIPGAALAGAAAASLAGAVALGALAVTWVGPWMVAFIAVGAFLVVAYNLEAFGGRFHSDTWFAAAWGAFPVLTGAFAQEGRVSGGAALAAAGALAVSLAQRRLSAPARHLRRRAIRVEATLTEARGAARVLGREDLLRPLEGALRALAWGVVLLAVGLVVARLAP